MCVCVICTGVQEPLLQVRSSSAYRSSLPFGDKRFPLFRIWPRPWITQASHNPLVAGTVACPRSKDVVCAWRRWLFDLHHQPLLIFIFLWGGGKVVRPFQGLVHQVNRLRRLGGRWVNGYDGDVVRIRLRVISKRVYGRRQR